jgi:hypothetical protein
MVKRYGKYGRKVSLNVKWYGKYGKKLNSEKNMKNMKEN